jgi:uncharacterized protein
MAAEALTSANRPGRREDEERRAKLDIPVWPADLVETVLARSTSYRSSLHGPGHWRRVAFNGQALAAETTGADAEVAALFALFHDAMRLNDGHDPSHGPRAATLARELSGLKGGHLVLLAAACDGHADGSVSDDPTIGVCWDADRLDLPRVGVTPDPRLMSTRAGRTRTLPGR